MASARAAHRVLQVLKESRLAEREHEGSFAELSGAKRTLHLAATSNLSVQPPAPPSRHKPAPPASMSGSSRVEEQKTAGGDASMRSQLAVSTSSGASSRGIPALDGGVPYSVELASAAAGSCSLVA